MPYKDKNKAKEYLKEYYLKNKGKIRKLQRKYFLKYPEKFILYGIKNRCNNPKDKEYQNYGGRGIKCLISLEKIKKLMERDGYWDLNKPSIDRIDNKGNYCYENCQFIEMNENRIKDRYKSILQYDLEGNFIREWESITEAQNKYGRTIIDCLRGKTKTSKGFIWKYKQ